MINQIFFNVLLYGFESLVFLYFANGFFNKKYSGKKIFIITFLSYLVLLCIYQLGNSALNAVSLLIINILLLKFLFFCNIKSALFYATIPICLMAASEWIILSLFAIFTDQKFDAYQTNFNIFIIHNVLNKFVYFLLCFIIVRFFSSKTGEVGKSSLFWGLMVMPVSSILVLLVFHNITLSTQLNDTLMSFCAIAALILLFSNAIIFLIYQHFVTTAEELIELRAVKEQEQIDATYMEILEKNADDMRIFTHGIKHHFESIANMDNTDSVREYISAIYPDLELVSCTGMSKNKSFDVIINKYLAICTKKGIDIKFDVKTFNLDFIKPADLSIILNNLLDNAVLASEKSKEKFINVSCFCRNERMGALKITNSNDFKPNSKFGILLTTKNDKQSHGFGIKSVERVIKKYNGILDWSYDEDSARFEITIVFPLNKQKII